MRKFFSLIAAVLFAGSMMADSYTITFKDNGLGSGDNSTSLTSTTVTDYVAEGADYVSAVAVSGKVYNGQEGYGLKFGNSSNPGSITLTLAAAVTPTSIVMNASPWSSSEGSGLLQDSVFATKSTGAKGTFADFTYYYDGATEVTTIVVGTSAKRGYVKSVTVNFEGGVTPPPADTYTVAGNDAAIFGEAWNPALTANDMTLANGIYKWEKANLNLTAGTIQFKVVKNHSWDVAYPAQNYEVSIAEDGEYTLTITFDPSNEAVAAEAVKNEPLADPTNCAEAAEAALSVSANNELYNNGAVYTIEGYVTGIKTAYSDQYHNISFWMADAADGGEVLQAYRAACASEADAPQVGDKVAVTGSLTKYGTTPEFAAGCTYVITEPYIPVEPEINYYVAGSMGVWGPDEAYKLTPSNNGEYEGEFTFAANDEFKVIGYDGTTVTWFPEGMGNNYQITEAGDYKITFNPAGNVEGWYAGFFNVVKKEAPIVHQYEVAEAIAAGLQENDEVLVRGVITKIEFKGANFAKFGSVNIYVADATDAEGEFEFFNCYSLNADTFRTSIPNYDPTDKTWAQFNEVADENGNTIHVGDTVIAFGKYKLYNSTHELNTGCYLVDIKHAP
ncbi:MAG: hypothetical protein IKP93_00590, partial [Paludibacteraceae bacterium]|nr:hypothetical protein [Paludibacteraceae bacterium]